MSLRELVRVLMLNIKLDIIVSILVNEIKTLSVY